MEEADEPPLSRLTDRIHSSARISAAERATTSHSTSPRRPNTFRAQSHNVSNRPGSSPLTHNQHHAAVDSDWEDKPHNNVPDAIPANHPPPAPPPGAENIKVEENKDTTLNNTGKPPWPKRIVAGCQRFIIHLKDAILHSWLNLLLVFVPVGIAVNFAPLPESAKPTVIFSMNAIAIVPLAGLLAHATECVASSMGDTWASLLNVTFGNAVELIIFIIALAKDQISTVQAAILGSILANLLLILGMAFLLGGLRFQEQVYNSTVTQMSACLLSLSVTSLLLPVYLRSCPINMQC